MENKDQPPSEGQVQGEGDYVAGRRFQEEERSFVESGQVEKKAREAAEALDGPEGAELERARIETGEGRVASPPAPPAEGTASDPDADDRLDSGSKRRSPPAIRCQSSMWTDRKLTIEVRRNRS